MPIVHFIRHAESTSNAGERTDNPTDIELTPRGLEQSAMIAAQWRQAPTLIIASPYIRTQLSARPTLERFPAASYDVWPIQEFTYLSLTQGQPTSMLERRPRIEAFWQRADPDYVDGPGAESFNDMLQRIDIMIESLKNLKLKENDFITVFTHGQIMHFMRMRALSPRLTPAQMMRHFPLFAQASPIENCTILKATANIKEFQLDTTLYPLAER